MLIGLQGLVFWTPTWAVGIFPGVLAPITALVFAVVGLIWMVRIFRGPTSEPPPWRYRDY